MRQGAAAEAGEWRDWRVGDRVLGVYEVTGALGQGGMGLVHRVRHLGWDTDLAVKSPRPELFRDEADRERFVREAQTWVGLELHPHLCGCHYVRTIGGVPRVFAEYVNGGSLRESIDEGRLYRGARDEVLGRILDIAIQMARGLAHAHLNGVVHQDVKPGNVLLDRQGTAKITDFGLARARHFGIRSPSSGRAAGQATLLVTHGGLTPAYASPEQVRGVPLSRRTDVWSFAVSVLEMFTGAVTWGVGSAAGAALAAYRLSPPPDAPVASMPAALAELLERCLRERVEERPGDLAAVAGELAEVYAREVARPYPRRVESAAEHRADGLNNRAMSLLDLGRPREAEAALAEAHAADPQHPQATYNLGLMRWRSGTLADDALVDRLESARASAGGPSPADHLLAHVHLERGDHESALPLLRAAAVTAEATADTDAGTALRDALAHLEREPAVGGRLLATFTGHRAFVHAVSLSADGSLALSGDHAGDVRLWDTATGRPRALRGHRAAVHAVCLSRDGRLALTGGYDGDVRLWDTGTGRCLRMLSGHTGSVRAVCLASDGSTALTGGWDGTLRWWEVATGRCLRVVHSPEGPGGGREVNDACLSDDGRLALFVGGRTVLWDLANDRRVQTLDGDTIWPAALSHDRRRALTGGGDRALVWWDLVTGRSLRTLQADARPPWTAELSIDGRFAVSGAIGGTLRWWEPATGRCLRTYDAHLAQVTSVSLSGDGRRVLTGGDERVRLWQLPTPDAYTAPFQICRPRSHTELTRHDDRVAALLDDAESAAGRQRYADALALVAEARALPGHERDTRALAAWHRLSLVTVRTGVRGAWPAGTVELPTSGRQAHATADGRRALCADLDTLRLWDFEDGGRCVRTFDGHDGAVEAVSLSADERFALSGGRDGTVRVWDVRTGRCLRVLEGHGAKIRSVSFSGDGRFAFSGGEDGSVRWWERATGRMLRAYEYAGQGVYSVCPSADGRFVLSSGKGGRARMWELDSGHCARIFEDLARKADIEPPPPGTLHSAQLTADGRHAVTANGDGRVVLWDVAGGRRLHVFDEYVGSDGHAEPMTSLSLSADGRFALAANWDTTVRLLDLRAGRCLRTLGGHRRWVLSVHLSADGRYAVSTGTDRTLRRWELDWDLEAREPADWDEGARPHLEAFLAAHTPFGRPVPPGLQVVSYDPQLARHGKPVWSQADSDALLRHLARAGYGWLRADGVRAELARTAAAWQGPRPLPAPRRGPARVLSSASRRYRAWRGRPRS
ncbi:WD40 repeat domain-containing serine/threonine protein kinase [Streptomyces hawaiiensis]|uniref:WD40 repeat domain-containing serine/threonine protein kinase n=1 Tax=Streptomyces hawaiiensis TaxID=67305 RepID=UPI003654FB20